MPSVQKIQEPKIISTNYLTSQPTNQPINQPINQTINQSTIRPFKHSTIITLILLVLNKPLVGFSSLLNNTVPGKINHLDGAGPFDPFWSTKMQCAVIISEIDIAIHYDKLYLSRWQASKSYCWPFSIEPFSHIIPYSHYRPLTCPYKVVVV